MEFAAPAIDGIAHVAHVVRHLDAATPGQERHDRHVLSLHRGGGVYRLGDEVPRVDHAALILLPAGDAGSNALSGRIVSWWCQFAGAAVRGERRGAALTLGGTTVQRPRLRPLAASEDRTAGAWFRELHAAWRLATPAAQLHAQARLLDLLGLWAATPAAGDALVDRYRQVIERHACDPRRRQADLAALVGGDGERLSRDFHRAIGCTPHAYRIRQRVQRARELLVHERLPLAETARRCGFADAGYLCRVFRQHLGISPQAYARRCGLGADSA
jgi:AraC-like DNA-binding protein